ncbi:hypothetical protein ACEWY4_005451 [Coilia grayii]|uniref:Uncharacterized protein n=1 Tax=Coilia grayii TaxID=363190 RepID=A0ABD1KIZ5_9TELE
MASAGNLVWVGFIDALPVVGSVKEAVEWVLAVQADDLALAKAKLQVIDGKLGKKSKYHDFSRSSSGYSSDSTCAGYSSDSSSFSGSSPGKSAGQAAMPVASVPDTNLAAYIKEVVGNKRQQTGRAPVKSGTDQRKVQQIRDMTLQKIQRINQNFQLNEPLEDVHVRSRRGEHVINNGVITFYHKAVEDFMKNTYRQLNDLGIDCLLDNNTRDAIQSELVVHFSEDEFYINANAVIYGQYSQALKQALANWLAEPSQENSEEVSRIVLAMNERDNNVDAAYVDPLARDKYIGRRNDRGSQQRQQRFETVRDEVATMFTNWRDYFNQAYAKIQEMRRNM